MPFPDRNHHDCEYMLMYVLQPVNVLKVLIPGIVSKSRLTTFRPPDKSSCMRTLILGIMCTALAVTLTYLKETSASLADF